MCVWVCLSIPALLFIYSCMCSFTCMSNIYVGLGECVSGLSMSLSVCLCVCLFVRLSDIYIYIYIYIYILTMFARFYCKHHLVVRKHGRDRQNTARQSFIYCRRKEGRKGERKHTSCTSWMNYQLIDISISISIYIIYIYIYIYIYICICIIYIS